MTYLHESAEVVRYTFPEALAPIAMRLFGEHGLLDQFELKEPEDGVVDFVHHHGEDVQSDALDLALHKARLPHDLSWGRSTTTDGGWVQVRTERLADGQLATCSKRVHAGEHYLEIENLDSALRRLGIEAVADTIKSEAARIAYLSSLEEVTIEPEHEEALAACQRYFSTVDVTYWGDGSDGTAVELRREVLPPSIGTCDLAALRVSTGDRAAAVNVKASGDSIVFGIGLGLDPDDKLVEVDLNYNDGRPIANVRPGPSGQAVNADGDPISDDDAQATLRYALRVS